MKKLTICNAAVISVGNAFFSIHRADLYSNRRLRFLFSFLEKTPEIASQIISASNWQEGVGGDNDV